MCVKMMLTLFPFYLWHLRYFPPLKFLSLNQMKKNVMGRSYPFKERLFLCFLVGFFDLKWEN